jgi:hypothetical protein
MKLIMEAGKQEIGGCCGVPPLRMRMPLNRVLNKNAIGAPA